MSAWTLPALECTQMFRRRFLAGGLDAALSATPALAVPGLQVDITGSTYIGIDPDPNKNESFITMDDIHTVNTYLAPSGMGSPNFMTDEYFLSIALVPPVGPAGEVLGSFTVNGNTIFVTSGMTYGVPPDETMVTQDGGDLGKHGIFERILLTSRSCSTPCRKSTRSIQ